MGLGLSHRRAIIIKSSSSAFATANGTTKRRTQKAHAQETLPVACICMCHQWQLSRGVLQGYCIGHSPPPPPRHRHLQGSDAFAAAAAAAAGSGNRQSTDMQIKFRQNPNALRRSPSSSSAAIAAAGSAILLALLPPALAFSCSTNPQLLPPSSPNSLRKRCKHKRTGCAHKMILS